MPKRDKDRREIMTELNVRPDVAAFLQFLASNPGPKMNEMALADARASINIMRHVADADVGDLAKIENLVIPGPAGNIPARLYDARAERAPGLVMVFYHGGGFVIGDLDSHEPYCAEAARQLDMPVIAIDYRLAPEHPFPAAAEDAEAATRWIADNIPCTGMILSGDSAGGNLTIATSMALRDRPAAKPVIAQHPIYPATSLSLDWQSYRDCSEDFFLTRELMDWFGAQYLWQEGDFRAHPLDFDQTGMPPSLVVTAGLDPLRDQGKAYADKLSASGVRTEYRCAEGNIHGYICMRKAIPSSQTDIDGNLAALKSLLEEVMAPA
jgi:acetyl esterase